MAEARRQAARPRVESPVNAAKVIRVILVDDHPVVRFGLAAIISLQSDMDVVGRSRLGRGGLRAVRQPACRRRAHGPAAPGHGRRGGDPQASRQPSGLRFIVLTTYDGDEDIRRALDAGAQAYLLKGMSHEDVTSAIRKVHSGQRCIPEPVSRRLADRPPHSELSPREVEVLELIAKGLSNREIGNTLGITEATVKWHVNIILSRLGVSDRTEAIVEALQRGILHLP